MAIISKEPYITPEMIAAWNAGGGRVYFYPNESINITTQWGAAAIYYGDIYLTIPEKIVGKKAIITCVGKEVGFFSNPITLPNLTDYQICIRCYRPSQASGAADITIIIYD